MQPTQIKMHGRGEFIHICNPPVSHLHDGDGGAAQSNSISCCCCGEDHVVVVCGCAGWFYLLKFPLAPLNQIKLQRGGGGGDGRVMKLDAILFIF